MKGNMSAISPNNRNLLLYLISQRPHAVVTELMKLCYLIDLTNVKKGKKQISDFAYRRYTYGPFDKQIYPCLESLVNDGIVLENLAYTATGNEYVTYEIGTDQEIPKPEFAKEDLQTIQEVLTVMEGHGAKALTDVAYKTKPMLKLGATLGGDEHLNELLDLAA